MTEWQQTADVVIVGSGIAGMAAAVAAAGRGCSVIILEKGIEVGGTTVRSSGEFWIPNNVHMAEEGFDDPREDCLRYMARLSYPGLYDPESPTLGLNQNEYELLATYYDRGSEAVEYMRAQGAIEARFSPDFDVRIGKPEYNAHIPENKAPYGRHLLSQGGSHTSGQGVFLIGGMRESLEKTDTKILLSHSVEGLVQDDSGRVIGVEVSAKGERQFIRARKGVIFGSGGFAHNKELCKKYMPTHLYGAASVETNTGDFIAMAVEAGASLGNMQTAWWGQVPVLESLWERGYMDYMMYFPWGDSMIMVNKDGKRVVNEKTPYMDRTYAHFQFDATTKTYHNQVLIMVYDGYLAMTPEPEGWTKIRRPVPPVGEYPEYQVLGETWEELAEQIDAQLGEMSGITGGIRLDKDFVTNLKETVTRFNHYAETGVDEEFHRGETPHEFNYSPKLRPELKNYTIGPFAGEGPYCAIIIGPACFDTCGGPRINASAQVITIDDQPIAGLYGAGNCVASPAGQAYWSGGATIGCGLIYGYIAGAHAAEQGG